ncbi:MAG: hypothetical protein M1812_006892 [Candelaria pacifica]|nr:MAG: hypothetical protein M1812_006892 [Candelaria pacifica]
MSARKTSPAARGPIPQPTPQGGVALPSTPEKIQSKFDLSISLSLSLWPALSLAIQNQWGGPLSSEKRDWFAGAISELFISSPDTDAEDVESMLLQVMNDEFEVNVEDESAWEVAEDILRLRVECAKGDWRGVDRLYERWVKGKGEVGGVFTRGEVEEGEEEGEWDSEGEEEDGDGDEQDVDMQEAPALVETKEKSKPEVDEEGFTKVMGKKRR